VVVPVHSKAPSRRRLLVPYAFISNEHVQMSTRMQERVPFVSKCSARLEDSAWWSKFASGESINISERGMQIQR
jgi:hypothetical protein